MKVKVIYFCILEVDDPMARTDKYHLILRHNLNKRLRSPEDKFRILHSHVTVVK